MDRIKIIEMAPSLDVFYEIEEGTAGNNGTSLRLSEGRASVETGAKFRPQFRFNPGGKGLNVARVLGRLTGARGIAVEVEIHVFCRPGPLTTALVEMLRTEKSLAGRVAVIHHPVGTPEPRICANAAITRGGGLVHEFNFSPYVGIDAAARDELLERVGSLDAAGSWVVLAGTPPSVAGNGIDPLLFRDAALRLRGAHVLVDTSGESLDRCLLGRMPHLEVVKINREEARQSAAPLARFRGIRIVTSEAGAEVHRGPHRLGAARIARPPAVRCTLGAGDSVTAGFLLGYLESGDPLEAVRYGQAAAQALVSSTRGIAGITPRRVDARLSCLELD